MNKRLKRLLANIHRKDGDDGGSGGGGGNSGGGVDYNSDAFKSAVNSAVEAATAGLKTKNDELVNKLNTTNEQLKNFEGLDAAAIKKMISEAGQSEEAKLIAEGKIDEVITKRLDKKQAEWEEQYNKVKTDFNSAAEAASTYKTKYESKMIEDTLRGKCLEANVRPEAIEDVLIRAGSVFSITENGEVEARDGQGNLVKTGDGNLLTPERYIESLKKTSPHYWPGSGGTGAGGSNSDFKNPNDAIDKLQNIATQNGGQFNLDEYRAMRKKMSGDDYHLRR